MSLPRRNNYLETYQLIWYTLPHKSLAALDGKILGPVKLEMQGAFKVHEAPT